MPKISPMLWFDRQAEAAANFYVSVFKNSKLLSTTHYGDSGPGPKGQVSTVTFELEGQRFTAINGGPLFTFSPAISFSVNVADQQELDDLWTKLSADPAAEQCGWLKDKFGLSWQIVPIALMDLMWSKSPGKSQRVMKTLLRMKKLDIAALQRAYDEA